MSRKRDIHLPESGLLHVTSIFLQKCMIFFSILLLWTEPPVAQSTSNSPHCLDANLEFLSHLPILPKRWDCRLVPPCVAQISRACVCVHMYV